MSTSKPRSANAVATTLAPRSWPSWPSLAIITRGRRPSASAKAAISRFSLLPALGAVVGGCVHAGHLLRVGAVAARRPSPARRLPRPPWRAARIAWIARSSRLPSPLSARRGQRVERRLHRPRVALRADLLAAARSACSRTACVVDLADVDRRLPWPSWYLLTPTITSWPESMRACFSAARRLDLQLGPARVDGLGHAAHRLDFLDDRPRRVGHVLGQLLHHVAAGPGVDHVGDVGLFLDDELRVARDARAELGRQRDRLVEARWCAAICVPPNTAAIASMVVRTTLLYGSCSVSDQPEVWQCVRSIRLFGFFGVEALHDAAPQQARRAHLGDLEIEVHADGPEEAQPAGELVDVQALGQRRLHVLLAVGQREGQLQRLVRAGLLHVVAGDRDRVELRHVLRRVLDDVADDPHDGSGG